MHKRRSGIAELADGNTAADGITGVGRHHRCQTVLPGSEW
jgi:hypothetical protein